MDLKTYCKTRIKNKTFSIMLGIFVLFYFSSIFYFIALKQVRNILLSVFATVVVVPMFLLVEYTFKIKFPPITQLLSLLLFSSGVVLGPAYNIYAVFPAFDDILHGVAGGLFFCIGFSIIQTSTQGMQSNFSLCLFGGICLSLSILFMWEIFEYLATVFFGSDMQDDQLIDNFNSYYLTGNYYDIKEVTDITKTVIYYGDGEMIVLDGYLDIGMHDTLLDLLVGLMGTIFMSLTLIFDHKFNLKLKKYIIPNSTKNQFNDSLDLSKA